LLLSHAHKIVIVDSTGVPLWLWRSKVCFVCSGTHLV